MSRVHTATGLAVAGLAGLLVLLAALDVTTGLGGPGWVLGLGAGAAGALLLVRLVAGDEVGPTPADAVTLVRAVLVGGVTALVADALLTPVATAPLVALCVVALALDGVDGWVARHTGTASRHGARFDMEVDAWLILVLSVHVADRIGVWVLLVGAARYLYVAAAASGLEWLRIPLPARYWRKVVAVVQGMALTAVSTGGLPEPAAAVAVGVALLLLTESFGRDVWWQWRRRAARPAGTPAPAAAAPPGR